MLAARSRSVAWLQSLRYFIYPTAPSYDLKDAVPFVYGESMTVVKQPAADLGKEGAKHYVGGISRNDKDDKCDKIERKNEDFAEGSPCPAHVLD